MNLDKFIEDIVRHTPRKRKSEIQLVVDLYNDYLSLGNSKPAISISKVLGISTTEAHNLLRKARRKNLLSHPGAGSRSREDAQRMSEIEVLIKAIEQRFTPFAFSCDCNEETCEKVRNTDRYAIGQYHTVQRIVEYLRENA